MLKYRIESQFVLRKIMSATSSNALSDALSQELITAMWDELHASGRITASRRSPNDPDVTWMVTAFGDGTESALYVQTMDGDTLYEDPMAHQVVYVRNRAGAQQPWSRWELQRSASL
jgi:hypothetical protein